jgi:hypothetical protein
MTSSTTTTVANYTSNTFNNFTSSRTISSTRLISTLIDFNFTSASSTLISKPNSSLTESMVGTTTPDLSSSETYASSIGPEVSSSTISSSLSTNRSIAYSGFSTSYISTTRRGWFVDFFYIRKSLFIQFLSLKIIAI